MEFKPGDVSQPKLHGYLLGAVAPRPIALVSTVDGNGNVNLSPFSFFNVFSSNPPIAIFSPARKGRDNTTKHTYENVKEIKECVINVVSYDMVQQTSLSSSEYEKGVNEFTKAGFTEVQSTLIQPPGVLESPARLECIVKDVVELGETGGAGNLVICEVKLVHISDQILDEKGHIDPNKIKLVGRMGGNWYNKAYGEALFSVEKPLTEPGIGVDLIPEDIRNSMILSGNDLGILGNAKEMPDETSVNEYKLMELADLFIQHEDDPKKLELEIHQKAKKLIQENRVEEAWKTLLSFNN